MVITHTINMELSRRPVPETVPVMQGDANSRNVAFKLLNNGLPWTPPDGTTAVIRYLKPDGTGGSYDTMPDGETAAWSIVDNTLTITLAPQVLTVPGNVHLTVALISDGAELHTFTTVVQVMRNPGLQATSEDYYKVRGALPASGWAPNMHLVTDADGNVVAVEGPVAGLPLPATAKVGQYFRVKSVDASGKVTAVEAVDLDVQTQESDGWCNLLDMSGKRYTDEVFGSSKISSTTPVEFAAGEYPLTWETTQTQSAESTYTRDETRWSFDISNMLAGDDVEIEVLFPTAEYTGLDYSYQGFRLNCYNTTLIGAKWFTMEYNQDGTGTFEVTAESLFESYTLEPISDASGTPIGFKISGKLAADLKHFGCCVTTSDFSNEKPFSYTCQVSHGSCDDIRYRVNYTGEESGDTEESTVGGLPVFVMETDYIANADENGVATLSAEESAVLTALAEADQAFIFQGRFTEYETAFTIAAPMSLFSSVSSVDPAHQVYYGSAHMLGAVEGLMLAKDFITGLWKFGLGGAIDSMT